MKTLAATFLIFVGFSSFAQQHFAGATTSQRIGLIQSGMNPAELANLSSKYEVQLFSVSANANNNKIGFGDLFGSESFESLIFRGTEAVDLRFDGELYGPGFAIKVDKWAFALTSKAYAKLDLVDVDVKIGDAVSTATLNALINGSTTINNNFNQRLNGTTWGEIGLSAANNFYDDGTHKLSAGATFKLLFPASYANFGADRFNGTITNNLGDVNLTNASANLNIAYSGNLGDEFTKFGDYTSSLFGRLGGVAADFGVNYRFVDQNDPTKYRLNAGLALRNLGSMKFKDSNNSQTNYVLSIQGIEALNLNQFQNVESLEEIEDILLASGYLDRTVSTKREFKVKLPTVFSAYADVQIVPKFFASVYIQQKLNGDEANDQITYQNVFSIAPRFALQHFEVWSNWSSNEISGISGGIGFRAYGFYLGSGSIITNLIADNKQADAFIGYSFGLD
ncbi:hypothetical protein [Flavobacterium sp.]|uniref:hypothetical protein n=1 Tax=Flavobacterium sp. TaxID=239 RepID=UPI00121532E0|nr:hypothetical protein [Flavobacterium sp.]RZJ72973.1 MAG: hypothetical protein EOO49_04920 [Flavobacterium sp.]